MAPKGDHLSGLTQAFSVRTAQPDRSSLFFSHRPAAKPETRCTAPTARASSRSLPEYSVLGFACSSPSSSCPPPPRCPCLAHARQVLSSHLTPGQMQGNAQSNMALGPAGAPGKCSLCDPVTHLPPVHQGPCRSIHCPTCALCPFLPSEWKSPPRIAQSPRYVSMRVPQ